MWASPAGNRPDRTRAAFGHAADQQAGRLPVEGVASAAIRIRQLIVLLPPVVGAEAQVVSAVDPAQAIASELVWLRFNE